MATLQGRKRKTSEYSLEAVHRLAQRGRMVYGSRKARKDAENLDYMPLDVCECLRNLEPRHYIESICYRDNEWFDIYLCNWLAPISTQNVFDNLYIKLKLYRNCTEIFLASFHIS